VAAKAQCFMGADLAHLAREAFHAHLRRLSPGQLSAVLASSSSSKKKKNRGGRKGGRSDVSPDQQSPDSYLQSSLPAAGPAVGGGVTAADFDSALSVVRPASLMAGSDFVPQDPPGEGIAALGGLDKVWQQLVIAIVEPVRALASGEPTPEMAILEEMGVGMPRGVVIHGPPGTGKTKLGLALAHELHGDARFMNVLCTDLVRAEHGESEKAIARVFTAARRASPCVLLLDQIEVIAQKRSLGEDGPSQESEHTMDRILSLLLVEIDGAASGAPRTGTEGNGAGLVIVATTHDIDLLEPALLRPGRLDQHVALELPGLDARKDILARHLAKMPVAHHCRAADTSGGGTPTARDELIDLIAHNTAGLSGADLERACQEAALEAIRQGDESVSWKHFSASEAEDADAAAPAADHAVAEVDADAHE
jgi:transitional endoplasmic reticulum ATPase